MNNNQLVESVNTLKTNIALAEKASIVTKGVYAMKAINVAYRIIAELVLREVQRNGDKK
jgi:hypothetical protein